MTQPSPAPPAGWYPDPETPGKQRWWNGYEWAPSVPTPRSTGVAIAAVVIGIIALVLSWVPLFAVLLGLTAIGLGIGGMHQSRGRGVTAILAGAASIVLSVIFTVSFDSSVSVQTPTAQLAETVPSIGDTVRNDAGVAFTVNAVNCGLTEIPDDVFDSVARGEFCEVAITFANESDAAITLFPSEITAMIGTAEYEPDGESTLGGGLWLESLNPGLAMDGLVYFDVPVGAAPDAVILDTGIFDDPVEIQVG